MKKILVFMFMIFIVTGLWAQSFYIESGYLPKVMELQWPNNGIISENVLYTDLGFELKWNILFLNGNVITWMVPRTDILNFVPFYTSYTVDTGIKFNIFTIGASHTCTHPVAALGNVIDPLLPKEVGFDKLYIRLDFKF